MSNIKINTESLRNILNLANDLPNSSDGVELPILTNEANESELFSGKELINQDGEIVTGTFTINNEINNQNLLLNELESALEGKAGIAGSNVIDRSIDLIEGDFTTWEDDKVTKIRNYVFYGCTSLTSVSFPVCTSIGNSVFYSCTNLTSVSFPKCTSIGNSAFEYCSKLTSVDFPKCTSIGSSAFYSCSSLTSVSFPVCTSIGTYAFNRCSKLTSVDFPKCTSIGNYTFSYCSKLTSVSFPVCTSIGYSAFAYCSKLTSVSFPKCTTIGSYAFRECTSLNTITLNASTICTLSNSNAFSNTAITSTTGSIFVPASLVTSYKAATNWTYFSNVIYGYGDSSGGNSGSGDTIIFYINNEEHDALPGMTWEEWVDSEYNNIGLQTDMFGRLTTGAAILYDENDDLEIQSSDEIIEGYTYALG